MTRKFTQQELRVPKNRAQFIYQMPVPMRIEILCQYEELANGGRGIEDYTSDGKTLREVHYHHMSDEWFQDVLSEYKLIDNEYASQ
jgi:hypothetical protein